MNIPLRSRRLMGALGLCAAAALVSPVLAGDRSASSDFQSRYQRERARCTHLPISDARANCLSEASTAAAAVLPAQSEAQRDSYARNAMERCAALPGADRSACIVRMHGFGTTQGSVAAGAISRELRVVERGPVQARPTN